MIPVRNLFLYRVAVQYELRYVTARCIYTAVCPNAGEARHHLQLVHRARLKYHGFRVVW